MIPLHLSVSISYWFIVTYKFTYSIIVSQNIYLCLLYNTFFLLLQECKKCSDELCMGDLCIVAPKLGENVCFHPSCFQCSICQELLVDLTYCVRDDILYCERHYADQIKPRCAACDEVSKLLTQMNVLTYLYFFVI